MTITIYLQGGMYTYTVSRELLCTVQGLSRNLKDYPCDKNTGLYVAVINQINVVPLSAFGHFARNHLL